VPDFLDRLGEELVRAGRAPRPDVGSEDGPQPRPRRPARRLRGPGRRSSRWALTAMLALAAVGGGAAIATSGRPTPGAVPPGEEAPLATAPAPRELQAFSVLRRDHRESDQIPQSMPIALSGASGANLGLARRAAGSGEDGVWVIPGKSSVCLLANWAAEHAGGAFCAPVAIALAGELFGAAASASAPGVDFIAGLVPDRVDAVVVRVHGGKPTTVLVREDVYRAKVAGLVTSVTFTGPRGTVRIAGAAPPIPAATH
jgi:hypothetical protein